MDDLSLMMGDGFAALFEQAQAQMQLPNFGMTDEQWKRSELMLLDLESELVRPEMGDLGDPEVLLEELRALEREVAAEAENPAERPQSALAVKPGDVMEFDVAMRNVAVGGVVKTVGSAVSEVLGPFGSNGVDYSVKPDGPQHKITFAVDLIVGDDVVGRGKAARERDARVAACYSFFQANEQLFNASGKARKKEFCQECGCFVNPVDHAKRCAVSEGRGKGGQYKSLVTSGKQWMRAWVTQVAVKRLPVGDFRDFVVANTPFVAAQLGSDVVGCVVHAVVTRVPSPKRTAVVRLHNSQFVLDKEYRRSAARMLFVLLGNNRFQRWLVLRCGASNWKDKI